MVWRNFPPGALWAMVLVGAGGLHPGACAAQERMHLGAPHSQANQFQSQVGDRVFFGDASADLGGRGRIALQAQADWLLRHTQVPVTIEGHADDTGSVQHNQEMAHRRAEMVRRQFMQMGIAAERIRVVAYGRDRPVAQCATPACAAQNRRAVTVIGVPQDTALDAAPRGNLLARRLPWRVN
jgi:peptidoglycan-associated lipoprotein